VNKIPIARSVATYFATLAVASALTGVFAAPAQADPAPTSTVEPPSSSTAPEPGAPSPTATATSQPAVPKPQAAPAQRAQVEVSLEFDKDAYQTNEDVHFTFKLKNIGESRAVGLQVAQFMGDPTDLTLVDWGPLRAKPGVTLEPGKTFELAVSGTIGDLEKDSTVVRGFVYDESGASTAPPFSFSAKVTRVTGHAVGTVFGDRNGNGKFDGGEQLGGIPLTLRYSSKTYTATSDADGKFDFGDIPAAKYVIGGDVIKGWLFPYDTIQIGPDTKDLLVRGAPPLNGALHASMA